MQYYPLNAGVETVGTLVIRSSHDVSQYALPVQRIVVGDGPRPGRLRRAHHGSVAGQIDGGSELQCDAAHGVRNAIAVAGRSGTVRRHVVHRGAADNRDRHPHRAGRQARTRDAKGADGWNAARGSRSFRGTRGKP